MDICCAGAILWHGPSQVFDAGPSPFVVMLALIFCCFSPWLWTFNQLRMMRSITLLCGWSSLWSYNFRAVWGGRSLLRVSLATSSNLLGHFLCFHIICQRTVRVFTVPSPPRLSVLGRHCPLWVTCLLSTPHCCFYHPSPRFQYRQTYLVLCVYLIGLQNGTVWVELAVVQALTVLRSPLSGLRRWMSVAFSFYHRR